MTVMASLILSFLLVVFLVPIARRSALSAGIVDRPDGRLKVHHEPVPYLGGIPLYLAYLVTLVTILEPDREVLAIIIGGSLMVLIGLIDDIGKLSPFLKLSAQILTVFVLIRLDIVVKFQFLPETVNYLITFLWIIGLCNAMNLTDIMDGLAGGVGAISSGVLCITTLLNGQLAYSILAASLCGTCLGFLVYNRPPAKIYMGDAGSQFLGVTLGILGLLGDYSHYNFLAIFNPILIFLLPIYDTAYVILMRLLAGRPVLRGSKDHLVVRLRLAGWPVPMIVGMMLTIHGIFGLASIYNMYASPRFSAGLYLFVFLVVTGLGIWLARVPVDRPDPGMPVYHGGSD